MDETWVVTSHHVHDMSAMMRLPWQRPLPSNGALNIQQLWASVGRTREPIVMKLVYNSKLGPQWQSRDQILKFLKLKMADGALNILQLWASGGRTREPILMLFGTQQHVRTRTTVTWLNIKIFKIQNGGRLPCWKIFEMPTNGPTGTQLGCHIPSCPRHVRHDAVAMATAVA